MGVFLLIGRVSLSWNPIFVYPVTHAIEPSDPKVTSHFWPVTYSINILIYPITDAFTPCHLM